MPPIIIFAMTWAIPAVAAPPAKAPPDNFCNGFAQGVVQTEQLNSGGSKICLPSPAPKRSETMKQFVSWVMADAARKEEGASAGFVRFMSEQYPCNKG